MKRKTLLERWAEDTEGLTFKGEPGYKDDWEDEPEPEEEKKEEEEIHVEIPKAEDIGTSLGDLFKGLKLD